VPGSVTGTSNSTLALPGFYCKNKGHVPAYVPHTYINDGVCDYDLCCDGSDEWAGVGGVKCPDKCGPIGKEFRRLEEIRQRTAMNAMRRREELVGEAKALKDGVVAKIAELENEIRGWETTKDDLERHYKETERRERGKVVSSKGKGSKTTILAGLAKQRVEGLRNALMGVAEKRDALKAKVGQLEAILSTFKEEYNPNFNDEGVKRAVKAWEDYAANKAPEIEALEYSADMELEELTKPDSETDGINWAEWETEEESDVDASECPLFDTFIHNFLTLHSLQVRGIPPPRIT
jgi:protein kinase C substrate 80K-H